jgi:hypothetical protein
VQAKGTPRKKMRRKKILRDGITEGYHKYKEKTPQGVTNMEERGIQLLPIIGVERTPT